MKLVIFTMFCDWRGFSAYIDSLVRTISVLSKAGIEWDYWSQTGDFYPEVAVNSALSRFMDTDATDILLIDSDESFEPEGVLRLLTHKEDIVAGSYRMKNNWNTYTCEMKRDANGAPVGRMLDDGSALIEAVKVSGGFTRIKRSALQKIMDTHDLDCTYNGVKIKRFFGPEIVDGVFISGDYMFATKCRDAGVEMYIDPNITIGHFGLVEHKGNLDKHLRQLKDAQETAEAFKIVAEMATKIEKRKAA